jgi:hypothetical protein
LIAACNNDAWRRQISLDANSHVLLIGTEAAMDSTEKHSP